MIIKENKILEEDTIKSWLSLDGFRYDCIHNTCRFTSDRDKYVMVGERAGSLFTLLGMCHFYICLLTSYRNE